MKFTAYLMKRTAFLCSIFCLLYACKKNIDKPCCDNETVKPRWVLTSILSQRFRGAGSWDIGMHRFEYDLNNRLMAYMEMDYIDPAFPPIRIDSFFYDAQDRVVQIKSANVRGGGGYKKIFVYGSGNRKRNSLKYDIGSGGAYYLLDSTVYVYNGAAVSKITYHITSNTSDTAIFVYDSRENLVKVKLGEFDQTFHELERYDEKVNPSRYFGVSSLEIEPSHPNVSWESDFWIMALAPVFSKNNYHLRRNGATYEYDVAYSALDTTLSSFGYFMQDIYADYSQAFEYRVGR